MNQQQTQARLQQLASEASALFDKADAEGRVLTPEEREEATEKVRRFKDLDARLKAFSVAEQIGTPGGSGLTGGEGRPLAHPDAGKAFIESEGYKKIADPATRGQRWSTGAIPVGSFQDLLDHARPRVRRGPRPCAPRAGRGAPRPARRARRGRSRCDRTRRRVASP
jgi:hypothetical protein